MIKGAIFDFDGTIADSMGIWETVVDEFFISNGWSPVPGLRKAIAPMTLPEAADYIIGKYKIDKTNEQFCDEVNAIVDYHYLNDVMPKAGVIDFIKMLGNENVKMCVATVTKRNLVVDVLKRWKIYDYFTDVLAVTDLNTSKHEPLIYRESLKVMGTSKEDSIVFEDAFHAASTAKNDGFLLGGIYEKYEKNAKGMQEISDIYITDYSGVTFNDLCKLTGDEQ